LAKISDEAAKNNYYFSVWRTY